MTLGQLWRWHDEPGLVAWVATPVGRAAVWLVALLLVPGAARVPVALALAPALVWPERSADVLALAALGVLLVRVPSPTDPLSLALRVATAGFVLGVLFLFFHAARRFRELPALVRRFPVATVHVALLGIVVVAVATRYALHVRRETPPAVPLVALQALMPFLLWRVSYLMLAGRRGTVARDRFRDHLFYLLPLWGGTQTPYGKGHGYLVQRRAVSDADLAASRLAGVKLLALAWIWWGLRRTLDAGVHGDGTVGLDWLAAHALGWPHLGEAVANGPEGYTLALRWAAVAAGLVGKVLDVAVYGHGVVGVLRLFGFRVFRNTYKPLLSPSVVEFWNRYFYYFKELMVEFFFYPTFLATARFGQRMRMFLAIMAAAAAGNLYYHLIRDFTEYVAIDASHTWSKIAGRATYSLVLALGIFVSMVREQGRRGTRTSGRVSALGRLRAIAGVWLFFGILNVWSVGSSTFGFGQRLRFSLGLVGITEAHE